MNVLVVNAGSTSLKLSLVDEEGTTRTVSALDAVDDDEFDVVGHRVVHGGERFVAPVVVDDEVIEALATLSELAPLHTTAALTALESARTALPTHPHVAVFDTAFHVTLPDVASTYAIPARWQELGLRRFGFHGLSVQWTAERVPVSRLVVCHLGGGCSVTAVRDGESVDTTMGFTPLDGLMMATRPGSVDPGILAYLLREGHIALSEVEEALHHQSGLLGISGLSSDMRDIVAARAAGHERATLAFDLYVARLRQGIAAMAATLGGIDAIVFTGGVGEHAGEVRVAACADFTWIGLSIDEHANAAASGDVEITSPESRVRVLVIHAREELMIARETARLVHDASTVDRERGNA